ncbi:54S ribosomal protein L23, mitochondrial [Zancudomyces culisetae]|uniref:Large ribosomal subunit protein uL23m n=1 Tax=Zancudomyces culisetae TaxID=1213189 RepID=A0A1R1PFA7_ZANCU|nr:54S ribosomal protein L23, mitochondrial [Zancudomyces culisetae]OMH79959.1 54S ribosomal protein L23, mitochondrial [Zancudomyces culisetae]OMH85018.1 54S ribosomal protein L23, mitochondrial [Zancudomyces culisetae]|eukprot:OMH79685.1 54S ribosomal protein L23, mitochondrial [Zancudomyces culisetae]
MSAIKQLFGTKKVHFPNLIFTIIRDNKLAPNQAAFKVPLNVNKFDIRDYLTHLYNVKVTDVRTLVLPGRTIIDKKTGQKTLTKRVKKAVVTLDKDFEYPPLPNLEEFGFWETKLYQKRIQNRLKGWKLINSTSDKFLSEKAKEVSAKEE